MRGVNSSRAGCGAVVPQRKFCVLGHYARFIVCATRSTTTAVAPRAPFQHAAMAMCSTSRPLRDAATKGVQTPVPADAASVGTPSQQTKSSSWAPRPGSRARSIPRARPDVRHLCDVDALAARRAGSNLLLSARSRRPRARVRRRGTPCDSVDPAPHHRRSAPHRLSSAPGRRAALAPARRSTRAVRSSGSQSAERMPRVQRVPTRIKYLCPLKNKNCCKTHASCMLHMMLLQRVG